jgi:hypothetical protein
MPVHAAECTDTVGERLRMYQYTSPESSRKYVSSLIEYVGKGTQEGFPKCFVNEETVSPYVQGSTTVATGRWESRKGNMVATVVTCT